MANGNSNQFNFVYRIQYDNSQHGSERAVKDTKALSEAAIGAKAKAVLALEEAGKAADSISKKSSLAANALTGSLGTVSSSLSGLLVPLTVIGEAYLFLEKAVSFFSSLISGTVAYHDNLLKVRYVNDDLTLSTKQLSDEVVGLAMNFGLTTEEAFKLEKTASQMKIPVELYDKFVLSSGRAAKVLGVSVEAASQFNYQLSRIPGFTNNFEAFDGLAAKLVSTFNVKPEDVFAAIDPSNPEVAKLLNETPKAYQEASMAGLATAESAMKHLGASGQKAMQLFVEMLNQTSSRGMILAAQVARSGGKQVADLQNMLRTGQTKQVFEDFLRMIEQVPRDRAGAMSEMWAQVYGIDPGTLAVLRNVVDVAGANVDAIAKKMAGAAGDTREAWEKQTDALTKYFDDKTAQLFLQIQPNLDKLKNGAIAFTSALLNEKVSPMVDQWLGKFKGLLSVMDRIEGIWKSISGEEENERKASRGMALRAVHEIQARRELDEFKSLEDALQHGMATLQDADAWSKSHAGIDYTALKAAFADEARLHVLADKLKAGKLLRWGEVQEGDFDALEGAFPGALKKGMAAGGIVQPIPGGSLVPIAEAGRPEAVLPLEKIPSLIGHVTQEEVVAAIKWLGAYLVQNLQPRSNMPMAPSPGMLPDVQRMLSHRS